MNNYKIIEQCTDYRIVQTEYNGISCTFRHDYFDDSVRIKFDDNFAKCNGFPSKEEMLSQIPEMKQTLLTANLGIIPEWILVKPDMGFVIPDKTKLN